MLKSLVKRLVPGSLLDAYHLALARFASAWYGHPSEQLFVIGVTGTNGKSTTVQYVGRLLEHAGRRVGWTSTAGFKVAEREWANEKKMTMLGRFATQRLLKEMVDAGCTHAIVETSSQGVTQHRHAGINYDVAVFTNLTSEHIEAHGGFENYKRAKGAFFAHVGASKRKQGTWGRTCPGLLDENEAIPKSLVVNIDDPYAAYFLSFPADKRYSYGVAGKATLTDAPPVPFVPIVAQHLALSERGSAFAVEDHAFQLAPIGLFNVYDALAAIAAGRAAGLAWDELQRGVAALAPVPGRLEFIDEGQPFPVVVDYAYEPVALQACYDALALVPHGRLIHVLGSAGGGRDTARRPVLGSLAAKNAALVFVTNEDPYDDDPRMIIDQVADGAMRAGKRDGADLFRVADRQQAITQAVAAAVPGDLVLVTGNGCEPVMAVARGKTIPWDDRIAVRQALRVRP